MQRQQQVRRQPKAPPPVGPHERDRTRQEEEEWVGMIDAQPEQVVPQVLRPSSPFHIVPTPAASLASGSNGPAAAPIFQGGDPLQQADPWNAGRPSPPGPPNPLRDARQQWLDRVAGQTQQQQQVQGPLATAPRPMPAATPSASQGPSRSPSELARGLPAGSVERGDAPQDWAPPQRMGINGEEVDQLLARLRQRTPIGMAAQLNFDPNAIDQANAERFFGPVDHQVQQGINQARHSRLEHQRITAGLAPGPPLSGWTPPYEWQRYQANSDHIPEYVPAIMAHPNYMNLEPPARPHMDPPAFPEHYSVAHNIPLAQPRNRTHNRYVREMTDAVYQMRRTRTADPGALPRTAFQPPMGDEDPNEIVEPPGIVETRPDRRRAVPEYLQEVHITQQLAMRRAEALRRMRAARNRPEGPWQKGKGKGKGKQQWEDIGEDMEVDGDLDADSVQARQRAVRPDVAITLSLIHI